MINHHKHHITYHQIRAGRALLDWSQDDLAEAAGLSIATIRKIEAGHISPRDKTSAFIRQALEDGGLEFIEPGGVRHKPEDINIYQGIHGSRAFFDDVYHSLQKNGGEIVQVWPSSYEFLGAIGDYKDIHYPRMNAISNNISVKAIVTEQKDISFVAPYCECRWISKHYVYSVPFYIYGDKYAIIMKGTDRAPKITVIQSSELAEGFRQQFYSMWEKASPMPTENGRGKGSDNGKVLKISARR